MPQPRNLKQDLLALGLLVLTVVGTVSLATYERADPNGEVWVPEDAYHKHDCLCVLVHDDDYDAALIELDTWIEHLESQGQVSIERYETGAKGMQAIISGLIGFAVRISVSH